MAILCVGHQPVSTFFQERLEASRLQHLATLLFKDNAQILYFSVVHTLIVNLGQLVQLFTQRLKGGSLLFVGHGRQLAQVGKLRMNGKDADARIGIRVGPGMGRGGIVDGQHLKHLLVRFSHPVNHHFQVTKVAHAKAATGTQREHGDEGARQLTVANLEEGLIHFLHTHLTISHLRYRECAVITCLPQHIAIIGGGNKFQFGLSLIKGINIHVYHPFVIVVLYHLQGTIGMPVAQARALARNIQAFALSQLGGTHNQAQCLFIFYGRHSLVVTTIYAIGKGRAIEKRVVRNVCPAVIYFIFAGIRHIHV